MDFLLLAQSINFGWTRNQFTNLPVRVVFAIKDAFLFLISLNTVAHGKGTVPWSIQ